MSVLNQSFLCPGLPAIALTTDTSILTASANDFGYAGIFERQVQALGRAGDVLIGLSTSGNSENVLRAFAYARQHGIGTIGLTGTPGGNSPRRLRRLHPGPGPKYAVHPRVAHHDRTHHLRPGRALTAALTSRISRRRFFITDRRCTRLFDGEPRIL